VDEMLVRDRRLGVLSSAAALPLRKRESRDRRVERTPALILDLFLSALDG